MDETTTLFKEQLQKLPEKIRSYVVSPDFSQNLNVLSDVYQLDPSARSILETEVVLVLMGLEDIDSLPGHLTPLFADSVPVDSDAMTVFSQDVYDYLIAPVETELGQFLSRQGATEDETEEATPRANSQSPSVSLVEQMRVYEEKKKKRLEEEQKNKRATPPEKSAFPSNQPVPENLPTDEPRMQEGSADSAADIPPLQEDAIPHHVETPSSPPPKKYPGNNDPYHEPVE